MQPRIRGTSRQSQGRSLRARPSRCLLKTLGAARCRREITTGGNRWKTKVLFLISGLAEGPVKAGQAMGKRAKKSPQSKAKRVAPQAPQVMRHNQNISARSSGTRYYGGTRYVGTRSYAGR